MELGHECAGVVLVHHLDCADRGPGREGPGGDLDVQAIAGDRSEPGGERARAAASNGHAGRGLCRRRDDERCQTRDEKR